ncbi:MAG: sigma-54 factor interaction domain-containing protein, partial [Candidatus Aminicenantes bacterium]|nr:sigma-54 factor interaction domain-containing protein [Candidatus Aminicenantes bacterium]
MDENTKIIGNSQPIKKLLEFIKISSKTDANILILGNTGVGKELAAMNIHLHSHRKDNPFKKINCANLNENLLESELFGHKKGAFTGAVDNKTGLIEEANLGTFFFDEIGDIPLILQAKLLSVIEEKKIRRLGENKYKKVNVRFIFATNKDLCYLIDKKKFRKDLYYRINELSYYISPLKERKEDIPLLVKSILKKNKADKIIIKKEALCKLQQ